MSVSRHLFKEKSSGASGYLVETVANSNILKLYQVSGSFIEGEQILVNDSEVNRSITTTKDYNLFDVHQVFSPASGIGGTFSADLVLDVPYFLSSPGSKYTIGSSGIVTSTSKFVGVSIGDIVSYSKKVRNSSNFQ